VTNLQYRLLASLKEEIFVAVLESNPNFPKKGYWLFGKVEGKMVKGVFLGNGSGWFIIEYAYKSAYLQLYNKTDGLHLNRYLIQDQDSKFFAPYIHSESIRHMVLNQQSYSNDYGALTISSKTPNVFLHSIDVRTKIRMNDQSCEDMTDNSCWMIKIEQSSENTEYIYIYKDAKIQLISNKVKNSILRGTLEISDTTDNGKIQFNYDQELRIDESHLTSTNKDLMTTDYNDITWVNANETQE